MLLTVCTMKAQNAVAVKSNLFYDATTTLNAGVEFGLAPRWSLDVSGNLNPWTFDEGKRWKHWMVQPEVRYWLCDRFMGHFFGLHALGGQYNFGNWDTDFEFLGTDFSKLKDYRYQGWYLGAGLAYGYSWVLGKHWNLEGELGLDTYTSITTNSTVTDAFPSWRKIRATTTSDLLKSRLTLSTVFNTRTYDLYHEIILQTN
jgi:hypothetical protein